MNKYYKNLILCGDIDNYCLLCKESFHLIIDIEKHIRWEKHRKNLKETSYLPKFRKDFIYKVGDYYYCEKCNIVTSNMTFLKKHVKCEKHNLLKNNPDAEIKKPAGIYDSGHVVIDKVILNKAQWNSIVENKCLICDVNVENIDKHTALENHIINLIQSVTKYKDNQYYRKINDELYHCFTCKKSYTALNFANHWVSCENHDDIEFKKLRELKSGKNVATYSEGVSKMVKMEKELIETLKDCFIINESNNVAICKQCKNFVSVDFKSMIEHLKFEHYDKRNERCVSSSESEEEEVLYREVIDNGKKRSELAKYGKEKCIKLNHNGAKGYCMLCDRFLSAHIRVFREHSRGETHRGHSERLGLKKSKARELNVYNMQDINSFITRVQFSPEEYSIWIDGALSLSVDSFYFLLDVKTNPRAIKTKCHACNEVFNKKEERGHCLSAKHINNFNAAKVVLKEGEFIRELQPNLFHCGYCNISISFSDILEKHVKTLDHVKLRAQGIMQANAGIYSNSWNPSVIDLVNENGDFYMKLLDHVYA